MCAGRSSSPVGWPARGTWPHRGVRWCRCARSGRSARWCRRAFVDRSHPPERLDQMMNPAVGLVVRRMRRPVRIGHRVIDIGFLDRFIAARPTTRQIPPPHELLVLRLGRYPGSGATPVGTVSGLRLAVLATLRTRFGGQNPEPAQIPRRITGAVKGALFGQHMNHRRRAPRRALPPPCSPHARIGRPGWLPRAPTRRPHRRDAALGARIVLTHRGRQRIQPLGQCGRISGMQMTREPRHPRTGPGSTSKYRLSSTFGGTRTPAGSNLATH